MTINENKIIKKLVHYRGVTAQEFAALCEGQLSKSKARGMLAAESNRRFYKATPADIQKVLVCISGCSIPELEIIDKSEKLCCELESLSKNGEDPGEDLIALGIANILGHKSNK